MRVGSYVLVRPRVQVEHCTARHRLWSGFSTAFTVWNGTGGLRNHTVVSGQAAVELLVLKKIITNLVNFDQFFSVFGTSATRL